MKWYTIMVKMRDRWFKRNKTPCWNRVNYRDMSQVILVITHNYYNLSRKQMQQKVALRSKGYDRIQKKTEDNHANTCTKSAWL